MWVRFGGGVEARRAGSEGAVDELGEHCGCNSVISGGFEVQGLGKGPAGELTGSEAQLNWELVCLHGPTGREPVLPVELWPALGERRLNPIKQAMYIKSARRPMETSSSTTR